MVRSLSAEEFEKFQDYVYRNIGIHLNDKKKALVQGRLLNRLMALGLSTYDEYYEYLQHNREEVSILTEIISTHVTHFFREEKQWQFLQRHLRTLKPSKLRIWSTACSSGEEAYSIAMFLLDKLDGPQWDIKILATDIAQSSLQQAARGVYARESLDGLPAGYRERFFLKDPNDPRMYRVCDEVKKMVLFRDFNLVYGDFSMFTQPFDMIFCRNVMIYFNAQTRIDLLGRLAALLKKNGLLLLGHSESIMNELPGMRFCASSIYEKV